MKKDIQLVIVIPVGPNCRPDFLADTLDSIQTYIRSGYQVLLADDSQRGTGEDIREQYPDCVVLETDRSMGKLGGLYVTLSRAFRYAIEHYRFEALLRMDTDAMIIGENPETAALDLFRSKPAIGIAGQYPLDYEGKPWDTGWPGGQIWKFLHTRAFFKNIRAHSRIALLYRSARKNGYNRGESVFGGACFYNPLLLQKLADLKLLPDTILGRVDLEEDHLFSLLAKAVGFQLGSLSGPGLPMGCAWKGLPASPETLLNDQKKIIHSTRFYGPMDETAIRKYFARQRATTNPVLTATV